MSDVVDLELCELPPSHTDKIEAVAERLRYPPEITPVGSAYHRLKTERGSCWFWSPQPHELATCTQFCNTQDSRIAEHAHAEHEWLICYKGELVVRIRWSEQALEAEMRRLQERLAVLERMSREGGDVVERVVLTRGSSVQINAGQPHDGECPNEETEYYAITIPKTADWQNGPLDGDR